MMKDKKINIITQILAKFHDPALTDVLVDEGIIKQASPKSLSFKKEYTVTIGLDQFAGNEDVIYAHLLKFMRDYEPHNQKEDRFQFEVTFERETEVYLAIGLVITDWVNVKEDGDDLHVNVC